MLRASIILLAALLGVLPFGRAAESAFTFTNAADRFAPVSGTAVLAPWDPDGTGWSASATVFDTAASFGLPAPPGGDKVVMQFPKCGPRQGYLLTHTGAANGSYADFGKVSNFTLIFDVLYPTASDGQWRALYQSNLLNSEDAEMYVRNATNGGLGIDGNYHGSVTPNAWHRIVLTVRAAEREGQLHKYIDGVFVGGQGTTGSGIDLRWALDPQVLLLTEDNDENAGGYICGIYFTDRQMTPDEVRALGGVSSAGPNIAGAPAAPLPQQLPRLARGIGHRGASSIRPENTLPSLVKCFADGAHAIETDIQLSAEGTVVVIHDGTIDRTTDGSGAVSSYTVAQLKTFDAGSWFDPAFTGTRIPTLVEYMQALPPGKILYLDIKVLNSAMVSGLRAAFNQAGFSEDRWWLYVYDDTGFASQLHEEFPNSIIVWEALPANWPNDPNAFNGLKALGVGGFDFGGNGGVLTPALALRLKQEGFFVATYTILDPDNMVLSAAKGADFMETDFPSILRDITPALSAGATLPNPADGAANVSSTVLSWLVGNGATAHRIHFGTSNPPPFVAQQTYDLYGPPALAAGTTYYWRVDEVTPGGTIAGPVWSFTTGGGGGGGGTGGVLYEWNFANGDLGSSMGAGGLAYSDGETPGLVAFGETDDALVPPHIAGVPAKYLHVPALAGQTNGLDLDLAASGPNGGGAYINQYSIIFDLYSPGAPGWQALFNTNPGNGNDADWYISPDGALGIAALGYSAPGVFTQDAWHRIIISLDLVAGRAAYYIDGVPVFQGTGIAGQFDGRFSLYSSQDAGPDVRLFNEGDGSGLYTHELYVSAFAVLDRELSAAEATALGGPRAGGIYSLPPGELPKLTLSLVSGTAQLTWPPVTGFGLQRSLNLALPWEDVSGTAGFGAYTEPVQPGGRAFYRLRRP